MESSEIKDIVIKYLVNETTPDETQLVLHWIQSSEQNKTDFLDMQALVDSILASTNPHKLNSEQAYQKLRKQFGNGKFGVKPTEKRILPFFLKIAAIFILGFGISWMMHNQVNQRVNVADAIRYQKIYVPYGSKTKLELPDGTKVTLNSGSSLKYPLQFGIKTRDVFLEGEAYFDVKKDKTKPFYVNTAGIHIKVLGTSFNVKSYPEEKTVETTLITGSVQIYSDKNMKTDANPILLKPNQKAIYTKSTGFIANQNITDSKKAEAKVRIEPIRVQSIVKTELFTSWKDNRLEFDNELFRDVIVKMERWYNVEVDVNNSALKEARFSGKFDKENIEQAMKALVVVTPFRYEINKNKIRIY